MSPNPSLRAVSGTHPGQLREVNQDSVLSEVRPKHLGPALGLLVVADGMGGHKAGDVASKLAVETIRKNLAWMLEQDDAEATVLAATGVDPPNSDEGTLERRLTRAIEEANRVIHDYALANKEEAGNLGCTVTCALVAGTKAVIGNVGDSRAYLYRQEELTQITDDHSYVWQLVREGFLHHDEIYDHPQRNVITRALGNQEDITVDTLTCLLEHGDRLMLCSDGVWEMIRDPAEIAAALDADDLEQVVHRLIMAANEHGGLDNIGVVVAEFLSNEPAGR